MATAVLDIRGGLIRPEDAGYEEARRVHNGDGPGAGAGVTSSACAQSRCSTTAIAVQPCAPGRS